MMDIQTTLDRVDDIVHDFELRELETLNEDIRDYIREQDNHIGDLEAKLDELGYL